MLRLMLCPYDEVNCDQHCGRGAEKRDCDSLNELTDRDIFGRHLKPGERSAVFDSRSSVIRNYYGGQGISFFYLKLENEVARVEIPSWVADRPELLDLTHAVILKQCDSGMGYPVALMEAHEQAVVSGADREQFWRLVQGELERDNMSAAVSAKNWSKRMKWL
jgi:NurA-like 5'-3' nuclease